MKQTDGGITYAEVSFAKQNNLPTAQGQGRHGRLHRASAATRVSKSIDGGFTVTGTGNDLAGKPRLHEDDRLPDLDGLLRDRLQKYSDAAKGKLIKAFLTYAVADGQTAADPLGFAPLPQ